MSDGLSSATTARFEATGRPPLWRRLVLARLARLVGGSLAVRDAWGRVEFGDEPGHRSCGIRVMEPRFYRRVALGGSVGAASSYIDGDWTSDDLVDVLRLFTRNVEATDRLERGLARFTDPLQRIAHAVRANTRRGSRRNIVAHYDLGNDFFELFLDETMTYSAAYFAHPGMTLAEASTAKLDRLCRKLGLTPRDRVLEIGGGWGSFALHAAGTYGCRVVTTTISPAQHAYATRRAAAAGLADRIEVILCDYRDLEGVFDKIVSIEMIEAVGHRYLPTFFERCRARLQPGGRLAVQAITMPDHRYRQYLRSVDFIRTHVFPGSCVPSLSALLGACAKTTNLRLVDLEDLTPHYARTLASWRRQFRSRLDEVRGLGHDDAFIRLWDFYLAYCEAGFAERYAGSVQLVFADAADQERTPVERDDSR